MRWSIRYQLLVPLLVLLVGVVGICSWTAAASADRAWQQIETQVRNVARTFCEFHFPLNENVLDQVRGLSGAEYLLVTADGRVVRAPLGHLTDRWRRHVVKGRKIAAAYYEAAAFESLKEGLRETSSAFCRQLNYSRQSVRC